MAMVIDVAGASCRTSAPPQVLIVPRRRAPAAFHILVQQHAQEAPLAVITGIVRRMAGLGVHLSWDTQTFKAGKHPGQHGPGICDFLSHTLSAHTDCDLAAIHRELLPLHGNDGTPGSGVFVFGPEESQDAVVVHAQHGGLAVAIEKIRQASDPYGVNVRIAPGGLALQGISPALLLRSSPKSASPQTHMPCTGPSA